MADDEIIKALECCISSNHLIACWKCPAVKFNMCCDGSSKISSGIANAVVDLINRQKAEIESLNIQLNNAKVHQKETKKELQNEKLLRFNEKYIKSEARKELKDRIKNSCRVMGMDYCEYYIKDDIDRVLEEMENTDE